MSWWTLPSASSGFGDWFIGINNMLGNNMLMIAFMFMIFFITFMLGIKNTTFNKAMIYSLAFTTVTSFIMSALLKSGAELTLIPLVALALSVVIDNR